VRRRCISRRKPWQDLWWQRGIHISSGEIYNGGPASSSTPPTSSSARRDLLASTARCGLLSAARRAFLRSSNKPTRSVVSPAEAELQKKHSHPHSHRPQEHEAPSILPVSVLILCSFSDHQLHPVRRGRLRFVFPFT
jgi:hypothetical protein